ncbi:MAG: SWIM zinc finger family protein, partial [Flavobacteriaceae bacterium]|nr:SWIM zinc finger family protein [Flavobacteriaceae bacterium]
MRIPLNTFEQIIDETILQRGLSYFKKGYVTDFSEIDIGEYEALVLGTEEYTVQIKIQNDIIEEHRCDCPYDMGPVCKHIVAVIFNLQKDLLGLELSTSTKSAVRKKPKAKSVAQQVKELLKTIPPEELVSFIEETSKSDRKFRNLFLASFGHLSDNQSKEFYQKQIH